MRSPALPPRPALGLLLGALGLVCVGCRNKLAIAMRVASERNAVLSEPPRREHFFVRDPVSKRPSEEINGLYRADGTFVRDGVQRDWYPEGTLRRERSYVRDQPHGTWLRFWRNGALRMAHDHDPSRPTPMVHWHPNGVVAAEGQALAGLRVGPWIERWSNGQLRSRGSWAAGSESGLWEYFDRSGRLLQRGTYRAGAKVGEWERPGAKEAPGR